MRNECRVCLRFVLSWIAFDMNKSRLLLSILFLAQFALFYQYANREVIWAYPTANDQTAYLLETYSLSHNVQQTGFPGSLGRYFHKPHGTGFMLPLQGLLSQVFLGRGRLPALLINFLYFCLLEAVLFTTARWLTRRESFAWLSVGLLMLQQSAFYYSGGLFDFRIDFIACCLYGVFLCLMIRSDGLRDKRWLTAALACAVLLISFRFITFVYLIGFFLTLLAALIVVWIFRRAAGQETTTSVDAIKHGAATGAIWLACTSPIILLNWRSIHDYYVVGHLTGEEKHIRAAQFGINGISGHLTYYFKSLLTDHLGRTFIIIWLALAATAFVLHLISRWRKVVPHDRLLENSHLVALLMVLASIFSPWLILTANESKSPVVGSVLGPPLVVLVLVLLAVCCHRNESEQTPWLPGTWGWSLVSACVFLFGCGHWMEQLSTESWLSKRRASVENINQLYDYVVDQATQFGMVCPAFSTDYINDWLAYQNIVVHDYERDGRWFDARNTRLGYSIFAQSRDAVLEDLNRSDFVLLTDYPKEGVYPFWESMRTLAPEMRNWCEKNLMRGRKFRIDDGTVTPYMRPSAAIEGLSAGWITPEGVRLRVLDSALAWLRATSKSRLVLEGNDRRDWLPKAPAVTARLLRSDGSLVAEVALPATFMQKDPTRYRVRIDLEELLAHREVTGDMVIALDFGNSWFIPKDIGINGDTRKLVVCAPTTIRFE